MSESRQTPVLLEVRNLSTRLGNGERAIRAVDGVDLEIRPGETFALLGESGCGKSMLALSLMRLLPPAGRIISGKVLLDGQDLLEMPEQSMRSVRGGGIGMIFQEPMTSLNPVLSIGEQIAEAVRLHDTDAAMEPRKRVEELLALVGIPDPQRRIDEYPHQLSGGMKQRVMIAMALAGRPRMLIADEPTTALDVTIQAQVLSLLKELQRKTGMAILLITHDLGVVAEVADRVAVMYAGQVIELAGRQEFFARPGHPYSRKLFSSLPTAGKRGLALDVIEGMVPPLNQRFTHCRFLDRCDLAQPECRGAPPPMRAGPGGRLTRCYLAQLPALSQAAADSASTESSESQTLLRVEGLKVHFPIHRGVLRRVVGHVRAVDGLSMRINAGRTLALVGESGCGKTTVGRGILQLQRPTAGQVIFEDQDLTTLSGARLKAFRARLQVIFQDPMASMNPRMLVGDIVAEGMQAQGIGKSRAERLLRVEALLEKVGLPAEAVHRYPHEFSGGQRQRICIARALAVSPRLIVCDEPTSALDVSVQAQVLNLLKDLQQSEGLSYLFITHNISVVDYLAHEVAVMYLGRIVELGEARLLLERPLHPYTRALLAAAPRIEQGSKSQPGQPKLQLAGDMPSPANPPSGCYFHPRCPEANETCRKVYPEQRQLPDGRLITCHRVE